MEQRLAERKYQEFLVVDIEEFLKVWSSELKAQKLEQTGKIRSD